MYDAGKIFGGAVIFAALVLFPLWYNAASGKTDYVPKPEPPEGMKECVMEKEYMTANHMDLLNNWRDEYVRKNQLIHESHDGKKYYKSLTKTCLSCHAKKKFCDECHNYVGAEPYCWDCHVNPEELK